MQAAPVHSPPAALHLCLHAASKAGLVAMVRMQQLVPFQMLSYPRGHNQTDYGQWYNTTTPYSIQYRVGGLKLGLSADARLAPKAPCMMRCCYPRVVGAQDALSAAAAAAALVAQFILQLCYSAACGLPGTAALTFAVHTEHGSCANPNPQMFYEPWFVASRAVYPSYDVRFRGYGYDKQNHVRVCMHWDCDQQQVLCVLNPVHAVWFR